MTRQEYRELVDQMDVEKFVEEISARESFYEGYRLGEKGFREDVNPYPENTLDYFCFESGVKHFEN